jgi:fructoselysine 6-phosphate deglycase
MNRNPNLVCADVDFRRVTGAAVTQRDRVRLVAKAAAGSARAFFMIGCGGSVKANIGDWR